MKKVRSPPLCKDTLGHFGDVAENSRAIYQNRPAKFTCNMSPTKKVNTYFSLLVINSAELITTNTEPTL